MEASVRTGLWQQWQNIWLGTLGIIFEHYYPNVWPVMASFAVASVCVMTEVSTITLITSMLVLHACQYMQNSEVVSTIAP